MDEKQEEVVGDCEFIGDSGMRGTFLLNLNFFDGDVCDRGSEFVASMDFICNSDKIFEMAESKFGKKNGKNKYGSPNLTQTNFIDFREGTLEQTQTKLLARNRSSMG